MSRRDWIKPRVWKCKECASCTAWFTSQGDYITEWPSWRRAMLRAVKEW